MANPSPDERVRATDLHDLITHRAAWRNALVIAKEHAEVSPPDVDDKGYWQHEIDVFDRTFAALSTPVPEEARYVRHKKRGTTYRVIGIGKMQAENWHEQADELARYPVDMAEVVTYQCLEDGALWVRPVAEFNDGRFEDVPAPERFAAARSSSTEAVEQEVESLRYILFLFREFWFQNVTQTKTGSDHHHPMWQAVAEALGPMNRDGTTPEEWQFITGRDKPFPSRPSPVPAACKPEGETHG